MRVQQAVVLIGVGILICCATAFASEGTPEFRSAGSRQNTILQEPCPANQFPPIEIAFASVISQTLPGTTTGIRCVTEVRRQGEPVRGVPIVLGGGLVDADGNAVSSLPTRTGTTNRAGQKTFTFPYATPPPGSELVVIMEGLLEGEADIDALDTTCGIIQRTPCTNSTSQACLSGKRFKVEVDARTSGGQFSPGKLIKSTKTEALFYFFSPGSTDLLVQLLQRCTSNDHFWVFAASNTNVEYDLTVTDTFNGESGAYSNPGAFEPILDTAAFATCP